MITKNLKLKTKNYRTINFAFGYSLLYCLFVYLLIGLFLQSANAANSSNSNYNLEIQDIDTAPEKSSPAPVSNDVTANFSENNPDEKVGIQSIFQTGPILISIPALAIDFGTLSPGNPVTRTSTITILNNSTDYQIMSFEDHPLSLPEKQIIADTTCDNGYCTEKEASLWKNDLTYGFGYRCLSQGNIFCAFPEEENYFKQFADLSRNEAWQTVITGLKNNQEQQAQISLKLNTAGNQKTGSYSNTVTFIVVPNF